MLCPDRSRACTVYLYMKPLKINTCRQLTLLQQLKVNDDDIWQHTLKSLPLSQLRPANPRAQLHWYPEVVSRQLPPFRQLVWLHITTKRQLFSVSPWNNLYILYGIKVWLNTWPCSEWNLFLLHATLLISKHISLVISKFPRRTFLFMYYNTSFFSTFKDIGLRIY